MKTYWDLSEQERAALTADDVQKYLDAELMMKGVLKVTEPELEAVPTVPEPDAAAFVVRIGGKYGRESTGVGFMTIEAAKAFVALGPMKVDSDYLETKSVEYLRPIEDPEIAEVPVYTEAAKNAVKADLKKADAIKASNERRREEYTKGLREQERALEGLWEDWTRCRELEAKLRAVLNTFNEYKGMAGQDDVAARFLAKVYPATLIEEAGERFGIAALIGDRAAE